MFRRILVATDGSAHSRRAIRFAARLARTCKASLTIFHAVAHYRAPYVMEGMAYQWPSEAEYRKSANNQARKILAQARAIASKNGVTARILQAYGDDTSRAIIAAARRSRAGLIVMASHGRRGIERLLLGSETQKVLARTKLPVLVVR
ncbi:MAG: universal stress protein [Gammaproteobacteria bacterium]|nr:universal stress protein [Gammaproteobacteria bacterium]